MQSNENFTEKPKSREDQIADEEELSKFYERVEDLEDDEDQDDDNDFFGMNDYEPYAGYEGGEY